MLIAYSTAQSTSLQRIFPHLSGFDAAFLLNIKWWPLNSTQIINLFFFHLRNNDTSPSHLLHLARCPTSFNTLQWTAQAINDEYHAGYTVKQKSLELSCVKNGQHCLTSAAAKMQLLPLLVSEYKSLTLFPQKSTEEKLPGNQCWFCFFSLLCSNSYNLMYFSVFKELRNFTRSTESSEKAFLLQFGNRNG